MGHSKPLFKTPAPLYLSAYEKRTPVIVGKYQKRMNGMGKIVS